MSFGGGGGKPPPAPMYVPPPAYREAPTYVQPTYQGSDLDKYVPQAAATYDLINESNAMEGAPTNGMVPNWMSLAKNPVSDWQVHQAMDNYKAMQAPGLAKSISDLNASGQGNSTYAGAAIGGQIGMNNLNAFGAGLANQQQQLQDILGGRQSYFSNDVQLAQDQNKLAIERALQVAGLQNQENMAQNQYALTNNQGFNGYNLTANTNHNQFDLGNYSNQLQAYQMQQQNSANKAAGIGGLISGGLKALTGLGGGGGMSSVMGGAIPSFGGGGGGFGSMNGYGNSFGGGGGSIFGASNFAQGDMF